MNVSKGSLWKRKMEGGGAAAGGESHGSPSLNSPVGRSHCSVTESPPSSILFCKTENFGVSFKNVNLFEKKCVWKERRTCQLIFLFWKYLSEILRKKKSPSVSCPDSYCTTVNWLSWIGLFGTHGNIFWSQSSGKTWEVYEPSTILISSYHQISKFIEPFILESII